MDKTFGHLRSLLHSPPSPDGWRRIWRFIDRADEERVRHELLPYAAELLDASWPDALRTTVYAWAERVRERGQPPLQWPLARTLSQLAEADVIARLDAGGHLSAIAHADLSVSADSHALHTLLHASSLSLRSFAYQGRMPQESPYEALCSRHPHLESIKLNTWEYPARHHSFAIGHAGLPRLHTLDLLHSLLDLDSTHALLHTTALPALRHLALNTRLAEDARDAAIAATPVIAQLHTLAISFNAPAFLQLLQSRAQAPALDALTLDGRISADTARSLGATPLAAPRQLTLLRARMSQEAMRQLGQWSGLDGVRSLTMNKPCDAGVALSTLLDNPWGAQLESLALRDATSVRLTAQRWPVLRSLSVESCGMDVLDPARLAHALPAIEELRIIRATEPNASIDALVQLDIFAQLRVLDLLNSKLSQDTQIGLISALHSHPTLQELNLTTCGLTNLRLRQLARTPMPHLHTLRLGSIPNVTAEDIAQLCAAPWLPQLRLLTLSIDRNDSYEIRAIRLRQLLLQHGASRHLQLSS